MCMNHLEQNFATPMRQVGLYCFEILVKAGFVEARQSFYSRIYSESVRDFRFILQGGFFCC